MGGLFGGGGSNNTSETPLTGISIQSSANGLPIQLVYGTTRVTPNLLWYGDFTAVPHTSTTSAGGKGGGETSSNTTYTYTASFVLALGEGLAQGVTKAWVDKTQITPSSYFSLFLGSSAQSPWSYLTSKHPGQDVNYPGIVYAAAASYDLGNSSSLPNHNFEVQGRCILSGFQDADPRDIVVDLLTNAQTGVPNAPALGDTTLYSAYCRSNGILLSPCYDSQQDAATMLTDIFQLTNTGAYFSEQKLKLIPYGDTAVTANGVTYSPNLTPGANFGDDDFLPQSGEDPIQVQRNAVAATINTTSDAFNQVTLEFLNRNNAYQAETSVSQDQVSIDTYGLRPMSSITAHQIADPTIAGIIADLILQRSVYIRAQYTFRVGWAWCGLEPTDLVTLTDSALGMNLYPVRIVGIEEDEYGTLTVTAEDAPPGVSSHVVAPVPTGGGYSVDYNAAPGGVGAVCIFEPPTERTSGGTGLEVWAAVSGASALWGGCNVWVSTDGTTYKQVGVVANPARVGHLTGLMGVSDTSLGLALDGMGGQLLSASATDAANLSTLMYIGGANHEYIAYQSATLTGANAYTLTGLVRDAYGSAASLHALNDPIVRIDDAVVSSGSLDLSMVGQTIKFKFQSFNVYGGGLQDLSTLTVYNYTVAGYGATGQQVSGLTATAVPGSAVLTKLAWNAVPGADHYVIDQSGDGTTWQRTGETKALTWADSALYGSATRFRVAAVRALAGSWSTTAFLAVSYVGMWNANSATPMWNANASTPMWSS